MDSKTKFAAETVLQLQQSLDQIPPHQATELSKQQIVRALSPQIFALRSRGYSWTAVAAMLSERGVPVSVAALRTYLRRVREQAATEKPRTQTKRGRDARADTLQPERPPPVVPPPSSNGQKPPATSPQPLGAAAASALATLHATVRGTPREPALRPGTLVPRPDTEDL